MNRFEEEVTEQLEWRIKDIATLTKLTTLNDSLTQEQENVLKKHLISTFYAYWEGFVKDVCQIYLRYINELNLNASQVQPSLLSFSFDYNIESYINLRDFDKKQKEINKIYVRFIADVNEGISLPTKVTTESNLNYEVLSRICKTLRLTLLDITYEKSLNKLLQFRNSAAHGDFNCPVDKLPIDEMRILVINLMSDMSINITEAYQNKSYLK